VLDGGILLEDVIGEEVEETEMKDDDVGEALLEQVMKCVSVEQGNVCHSVLVSYSVTYEPVVVVVVSCI
jgi:hypothetical protein